jgi:hypothetical protein
LARTLNLLFDTILAKHRFAEIAIPVALYHTQPSKETKVAGLQRFDFRHQHDNAPKQVLCGGSTLEVLDVRVTLIYLHFIELIF